MQHFLDVSSFIHHMIYLSMYSIIVSHTEFLYCCHCYVFPTSLSLCINIVCIFSFIEWLKNNMLMKNKQQWRFAWWKNVDAVLGSVCKMTLRRQDMTNWCFIHVYLITWLYYVHTASSSLPPTLPHSLTLFSPSSLSHFSWQSHSGDEC